jgi:DNA polymerase elongation subunit (family B)
MTIKLQILDLNQDDYEYNYKITIYGLTDKKKNIVCNVSGFKPYFYLKVPNNWNENYCKDIFLNNIDKRYKSIVELNHVKLKSCKEFLGHNIDEYGYPKKYSFLKLVFCSYRNFNNFKRSIKQFYSRNINTQNQKIKQWINCNLDECDSCLYDSNIPPLIKFIHDTNINPVGWIEIDNYTETTITEFTSDIEVNIKVIDIKPLSIEKINDFKIASFDIECDSSHGSFPVAIKSFEKPSRDILEVYIDMIKNYSEYTIEEKKDLLFDIISSIFKKTNNYNLDNVLLKTSTPNMPEDFIKTEFIVKLDLALSDKFKYKESIQLLTNMLQNLKYDTKSNPIQGDPIIQIGTVFYNYNTKTFKRVIIVIPYNSNDKDICDDIDNIEVIKCDKEETLLYEWMNLIKNENPDFVTGYNILGFDFKYIYERALEIGKYIGKTLYINDKEFYNFGRLNCNNFNNYYFKRCKYTDKNNLFGNVEKIATTYNTVSQIDMDGRIIFDMQKEISKSHNLESYKLDNVSSHFMRGIIDDIKTFKIIDEVLGNKRFIKLYTKNIRQLKKGDYITINTYSNIGEMLFMNGKKFKIDKIIDNILFIDITNIKFKKKELKNYFEIEWCLNKDDVPPSEIFRLHKEGGGSGRAKIAKYCIQDCELCIHLLLSLDIIVNNIGMADVCDVPLNFIFSRGQGIKVTSIVSKVCSMKNTRMPSLIQNKNDGGYEGAIVLDPTSGIYLEDPIAVLDFASLYPSSIIENNVSQETQILDMNYIEHLRKENKLQEMCNIVTYKNYKYVKSDTSKQIKKVLDETNPEITCYFIKSERECERGKIKKNTMGILPTVLDNLLTSRSDTKKLLKKEKDPDIKKILDGRQLSMKLSANSVYGQLGAPTSTIYRPQLAASTTAIGRQHIEDAKNGVFAWAKSVNLLNKPEIIYGDTDSVFVKFSRHTHEKIYNGIDALKYCIRCGIEAGKYVTKNILSSPQDLEYEKTYFPFVLITKKKYIGDLWVYEIDVDKNNFYRNSMGIVMKRRDNAPIVKYVFGNVIEILLIKKNYEIMVNWLEKTLSDILNGKFDEKYFIITKSLRSYYVNPETIAHKVLADRIGKRDPGNKPKSNDRIPFMYQKIQELEQNGYETIIDKKLIGYSKKKIDKLTGEFYKNGKPKNKKISVDDLTKPKYKKIKIQGKPKYKKRNIKPGERIENPHYMIENNIPIDYKYYISNQIMKPVEQVLELHDNYKKGLFDKYLV